MGSLNKDPTISGTILRVPHFRKLPDESGNSRVEVVRANHSMPATRRTLATATRTMLVARKMLKRPQEICWKVPSAMGRLGSR